jgi:hypothetical protein
MTDQIESFHIRYSLGAVSKVARQLPVIGPRDGLGAAESACDGNVT